MGNDFRFLDFEFTVSYSYEDGCWVGRVKGKSLATHGSTPEKAMARIVQVAKWCVEDVENDVL